MPACSCVAINTRVASSSACSDGAATSQLGMGYDPTVVVWIRFPAVIVFISGSFRQVLKGIKVLRPARGGFIHAGILDEHRYRICKVGRADPERRLIPGVIGVIQR